MNERHIEDLLRQSWKPEPPDGMRDRVLGNARRELIPRRGMQAFFTIRTLKPVLVGLALFVVLLTGVSEHARCVRIAALTGSDMGATTTNLCKSDIAKSRRDIAALCASTGYSGWMWDDRKGNDNEPDQAN